MTVSAFLNEAWPLFVFWHVAANAVPWLAIWFASIVDK